MAAIRSMNAADVFTYGAAALIASWMLARVYRSFALSRGIVDIPNSRSMHAEPTPRGGGISFVVVFISVLIAAMAEGFVSIRIGLAFLGGVPVAVIGFLDDRHSLSPGVRAMVQACSSAWALYWQGGVNELDLGYRVVHLGWLGSLLAGIALVWLTNLYNFMDGIDGCASAEAVVVAGVGSIMLFARGNHGLGLLSAVLSVACLGFTYWNWHPARLFMGDVGSGFLGFEFGVLALVADAAGSVPVLAWAILLGVFVVDASVTLILRLLGGNRFYEAHRTHIYQMAVTGGHSVNSVVGAIVMINLALSGAAALAFSAKHLLMVSFVFCQMALVGLYFALRRLLICNSMGARKGLSRPTM